jgi:N-acetylmuramoyl-L-alanine amidase
VQNGVREIDVNWKMAVKLESLLKTYPEIKVYKTRQVKDQVMKNEKRAKISNNLGTMLMIRLHCDTGKSNGFTIYYPNRQGKHDGKIGPEPYVIDASRDAAAAVHKGMHTVLKGSLTDRGIKGETKTYIGGKQGALTGSIFSEVPVVTVEMVFLSSKSDAKFIKSKEGQEKMAKALAAGILNYLRQSNALSHSPVRAASGTHR